MNLLLVLFIYSCSCASADVATDFTKLELVPNAYDSGPNELLEISFEGKPVAFGDVKLPYDVRDAPIVKWPADPNKYYTLISLNPDFPIPKQHSTRNLLLWLVVNIPGSDVDKGKILSEYTGSAPVKDAGRYRCSFTVHEQMEILDFNDEPYDGDRKIGNRVNWSARDFIDRYRLSQPIWGTVYLAEYDSYGDRVMREFLAGRREHEL